MARKIGVVLILAIAVALPSAILRVKPNSQAVLPLVMPGAGMPVNPPFPAPRNVRIRMLPDELNPVSIQVSWDPVPGATTYHVYTATAITDTTVYVPFCEPTLDQMGNMIWSYKFSFHPTFGDPYVVNYNDSAGYNPAMWSDLVTSGWSLDDNGTLSGTTWTRPFEVERDRFFYVKAVR